MSSRAVLAIDTAGPRIGVAAASDSHEPLHWEARATRGADALLLPAIQQTLQALDARGDTLVGVAVVVGPGAFTGLRVGLSAALGVAVARHVPVFPEGSLRARLRLTGHRPAVVLLDARKKRFYAQVFYADGSTEPPVDQPLELILSAMPAQSIALGQGAVVGVDRLHEAGVDVLDDPGRVPVVQLAEAALLGRIEPVDAAEVRLEYVRPPDAKRPVHLLVPPVSAG